MKVRLLREVRCWPMDGGHHPMVVPPGSYDAARCPNVTVTIVDHHGARLMVRTEDVIPLNDDGTQRMIRVRPDPGPTRQYFEWMYVANVDELQDAAFSAPPRRWQVETLDLTPEEVDALPEFEGW